MSVKVNCLVCRGTKRVDKIGGLHTKECPSCKGLGKVEKCQIYDSPINGLNAKEILNQDENKLKPTYKTEEPIEKIEQNLKSKEGKTKNGKGK